MRGESLQHGWKLISQLRAGRHARVRLQRGYRGGDSPRPVSPPAPPRPAQDGGPVAEEPGPGPCRHRRTGRCLPALRAALPRRVRAGRTRPGAPPQLAGPGLRVGRAPALSEGLLHRAPAAQRPRGPGGHPAADRHPPRPVPGPRLLEKKVGLGWRKVGTVPAKADHGEQAAYLSQELLPRLEQAKRGQRTVLFVDAAHFVYGPFLGYLWCLVRLFVPGPSGRKRYNVLAALDAITHQVIRVSNHAYLNAESVCALLREVAAAGLRGPITLVLDNARYQKCAVVQALAASLGIELLYLPSYSPNLNLIERLWRFVEKECLGCRVLPTYEAFTSAIDDCLANLNTRHGQQMASLLTLEFQLFDDDMPVLAA